MRSIIANILIFVLLGNSLFPSLGLEQATKLSEVVKHFREHNLDEVNKISFWDFLKLHYGADSKHFQSNRSEHHHLPNLDLNSIALFLVEGFFILELLFLILPIIRTRINHYKNLYQFSFSYLIYGPPKCELS